MPWQGGLKSGKQRSPKQPKPKLFGQDIFGWGWGVFHVKGWGQKLGYVLRNPLFRAISRDFCRDMPGVSEKLRKSLCSVPVPYDRPFGSGMPEETKRAREGVQNLRPREPQSPKKVCPTVRKESTRVRSCVLDSFWTPGRTLFGPWGSPGVEAAGRPLGLFPKI